MKKFLHDQTDLLMDGTAFFYEKAIVNYLLGKGMLEDILQFRLKGPCLDEVKPFQVHKAFVDIFLQITDSFQYFIKERPADNRGFLEYPFGLPFQSVQSCRDDPLYRGRNIFFYKCSSEFPGIFVFNKGVCFNQGVDDFLQVEGIPLCLLPDKHLQLFWYCFGLQERLHHVLGVGRRQVQESDLMIGLNTARLMASEQIETWTIHTEKNNGILEVGQDIPHKFYR